MSFIAKKVHKLQKGVLNAVRLGYKISFQELVKPVEQFCKDNFKGMQAVIRDPCYPTV